MIFSLRSPIDNIDTILHCLEESGKFFRRMLKIIVHRDAQQTVGRAHTAKQSIMLAIITQKVYTPDVMMTLEGITNHIPAAIMATVIDKNNFKSLLFSRHCAINAINKLRNAGLRIINRYYHRDFIFITHIHNELRP